MKKTKLLVEHSYDFDLLGLVSPVKDYKLAWGINESLGIKLIMESDLEIEFVSSTNLKISQYFLSLPFGFIQLLKNKSLNSADQVAYLIPELKNVDFFLVIQDETGQASADAFIQQIAKIPYIQTVMKLDVNKIKSKENLLTY
ncbi:IPExxxVDY family protein [Algoriphagus namhaensis]|uniref:IPExxxVDY family protein n=1 Tax=Algoriphagus namhaensis TaxID=915353 RepID=A0ABV8ATX6_9BACT